MTSTCTTTSTNIRTNASCSQSATQARQKGKEARPCKIAEARGWRHLILNLTPSWFSVTMGTGIVSILLRSLPYRTDFLHPMSTVVFVLNVVLFSAILCASVLRYVLYPAIWNLMIRHPAQSLFLGTAPMGFATIVTMFSLVCVPAWGGASANIAWAMWWIDVVASVACCMGLPFMMMYVHPASLSTMTAAWLLPVVAPIVAAACGSTVASVLPNEQHALWTIVVSYVLWGIGLPMAMIILAIYFQRLTVHKLPPKEAIVSVFLPIGPLGQGGFAVMQLGKMAMEIFPKTDTLHPLAGDFLYILGFIVALVLWGFGLLWLFFALASISRSRFPFNMGWWGFTFPLGVYSMATLTIGVELSSPFFKILGTLFAVSVMLLWLLVAAGTMRAAISGELFVAPCLQNADRTGRRQGGDQDV